MEQASDAGYHLAVPDEALEDTGAPQLRMQRRVARFNVRKHYAGRTWIWRRQLVGRAKRRGECEQKRSVREGQLAEDVLGHGVTSGQWSLSSSSGSRASDYAHGGSMSAVGQEAPEIVIVERPKIYQSDLGDMDEENAALYVSYRMRHEIKPRTLAEWRRQGKGPKYLSSPGGRHVWYRESDIDIWIERELLVDPAA